MNKLWITSILLGLTFALGACGSEETSTKKAADAEPKEETTEKNENKESVLEAYKKEVETSNDEPLTEVGQKTVDEGVGTVTLDKIEMVYRDYETAGLKIKLKDAKVLTISDMDPAYKEEVESSGVTITGNEMTLLQIDYDLENTTDETVIFNGLETAVPDNGKQIDIMMADLGTMSNPTSSEILAKASVESNFIAIPIEKDVKSVRLLPSDVLYDNVDHSVFHPKEISIQFK